MNLHSIKCRDHHYDWDEIHKPGFGYIYPITFHWNRCTSVPQNYEAENNDSVTELYVVNNRKRRFIDNWFRLMYLLTHELAAMNQPP